VQGRRPARVIPACAGCSPPASRWSVSPSHQLPLRGGGRPRRHFWPRREAALLARNGAAVDALETDAAAALDHAWINGANTGLAASELPRTVTGRYVLVPRQLGNQKGDYWATIRTRGRLAFAAAWTVMVLYLCLAALLAGLWL